MDTLIDLTGRIILVIGASQGIGRQTAITLSEVGARCVLAARNEEKLKDTLAALEGSGHGYRCLDVSDLVSIEPYIKEISAEFGPLDGMVYAAGVTNDRPLNLLTPEVLDATIKTNLEGFIETVRCVTKKKRFTPGMRIVGISSTAAFASPKAQAAYASSKAGMNGAVRSMATELSQKGVCINTVAPGMVRTAMYEEWYHNNGTDGERVKSLERREYLGIIEPVEVAELIAFLLSPSARFITGICLPVDGGLLSH